MEVFGRRGHCDAPQVDETTTVFDEISVFVVDREHAVAQALARRLDADSAVVVVGDTQDLHTFMRAVVHSRPDVVVLNAASPTTSSPKSRPA